jgi:hypothetical protein
MFIIGFVGIDNSLIRELISKFLLSYLMNVMGIIYHQYWLQGYVE